MPVTPNYAFEKRQRELAKKKKLEEKKARKRDAIVPAPDDAPPEAVHDAAAAPASPTMDATAGPRIHRKRSP